jgi:hypothetical protein
MTEMHATNSPPKIGDEMEDGTIYAGISPKTHQQIYVTPKDAPGILHF